MAISVPVNPLTHWSVEVSEALRAAVPATDSLLDRMSAYHMGWVDAQGQSASAGGKFVRSNLSCWAASACGAAPQVALPAACAVELIHSFTLIHDDVQDGDRLRRGRPTVWAMWGVDQAINAGDHLHTLALQQLLADVEGLAEPDRLARLRAAQIVLAAVDEVIVGQTLDLGHEGRPEMGCEAYLRMVEAKTGALLGASLEAGAVMAGADDRTRTGLRSAGRRIGVAFQLRDDWLGAWGEVALMGKSRNSDLARRKLTYPVAATYEAADQHGREQLRHLYEVRETGGEAEIRAILEELGANELTAQAATRHAEQAVADVRSCGLNEIHEEAFAGVARDLVERDR